MRVIGCDKFDVLFCFVASPSIPGIGTAMCGLKTPMLVLGRSIEDGYKGIGDGMGGVIMEKVGEGGLSWSVR